VRILVHTGGRIYLNERSTMSRATTRIIAAATATLVAGLGLTWTAGTASAAGYDDDGYCAGMSAPANTAIGNRAPVAVNDTARAIAGGSVTIKVLPNDSDPDGNALFVEGTSKPNRGEVCVDSNGELEYDAPASAASYVASFTYGVTDGDYYRTATVRVNVTGVTPLRAQLQHRLVFKKHSHTKVKNPAFVGFTNTNDRSILVLAGNPKKSRAQVQSVIPAGKSISFKTRTKKLLFIAALKDSSGNTVIVDIGVLNTATGAQGIITGEDEDARTTSSDRVVAKRWLRH
jgi:hypothetical protein